jgi:glycerol-3-phosphate dehydrogenase (NAD(P)+)
MNIGIIGAGSFGMALYHTLQSNKQNNLQITSRTNRKIDNFVSYKEILENEILVVSISTQYIQDFFSKYFIDKNQKIIITSKGIDFNTGLFIHDILLKYVKKENLFFISGPTFAINLKSNQPAVFSLGYYKKRNLDKIKNIFPKYIKVYPTKDIIGIEISGAYKNIIAIASGIVDGKGLGISAQAALISRGLIEITRFGKYYGAKKSTFLNISGAGDLFMTSLSENSRNYRFGKYLADGLTVKEAIKELDEVSEGYKTTYAINKLNQENKLYLPIADFVYRILEGEDINIIIKELIS